MSKAEDLDRVLEEFQDMALLLSGIPPLILNDNQISEL
jgi:hypothetical protein